MKILRLLLFVPAHALLAIRPGSVVAHRVQFSRSIDASRTRPLRRSTVRAHMVWDEYCVDLIEALART